MSQLCVLKVAVTVTVIVHQLLLILEPIVTVIAIVIETINARVTLTVT